MQKIGIATDPRARLAALQTASPFKLVIHVAVAVPFGSAHDVERRAHNLLRWKRASGEWFEVPLAEAVAVVRTAASTMTDCQPLDALPLFDFSGRPIEPPRDQMAPLRGALKRFWNAATGAG